MDIPSDITTTAMLPLGSGYKAGVFESIGDQDWYRVRLARGQAYAVDVRCDSSCSVTLRDPFGGSIRDQQFRAPRDGDYIVAVEERGNGSDAPHATRREVRIARDCAFDAATICATEVGSTFRGDHFFPGDTDWLSVSLRQGRAYDIVVARDQADFGTLTVADPWGGVLVEESEDGQQQVVTTTIRAFRPSETGTYYVGFGTLGDRGKYSATVRAR